jgi:DNA-binding transcriptional ArsR family regulator
MAVRVMDLTGTTPRLGVEIVATPCMEFLMGLTKFGMKESRETFEDGDTWFDQVRMKASPELREALARVGGPKESMWDPGLALESPPAWSVAEFLDRVEELAPEELWLMLAGYHLPPLRDEVGADTYLRAVDGDRAARISINRAARKWDIEEVAEEPPIFTMTPEETKKTALTVFRLWHRDIFAESEEDVRRILERDAAAKRSLASQTTPEKLIESATNGLEFSGQRWVRRVVLVPHVVMRPWNVSSAWEDSWIICYPVADESLGSDKSEPPARMVRLYKALSDEKRLRILKRLAAGKATLQELAESVGLAKSTTHHHMVILRSAGLVTVTDDIQSVYRLRTDTIPDASGLLQRFLEGARS